MPNRRSLACFSVLCAVLLALAPCSGLRAVAQSAPEPAPGWHSAGQGLNNARSQPNEFTLDPHNVHRLHPKWTFATGGNVSATPTVADGEVFFPDANGNLFAVRKSTGDLLWSRKISEYTNVAGSITRVSPAVSGRHVFLGDRTGQNTVRSGASLISVDRRTGALEWITTVESHPEALITGSPVVYNGVVYIGVSSGEEGYAEQASYPCCTFRGSMVAVDAETGRILWKTYTVPDNGGKPGGYSGASIWSPPAIDAARNLVYVGTANNYTVPADVVACQLAHPDTRCAATNDYFDSLLALDLKTGRIRWAQPLRTYDVWTLACIRSFAPRSNCPLPSSPDSGSGSGPNVIGDLVGIGQKDGTYSAFNAETGAPLWKTQVGPGGSTGGIQWGTATDGARIYVAIGNSESQPYMLKPSGQTITWGAWSALDARTGRILWQTADPTSGTSDPGSVSVANGVLYTGSNSGYMYALDTARGTILWSYNSGASVIDGPAIVGGLLFWGSGYSPKNGNRVFAFTIR